jgi:NAD+ kinase
MKICIHGRYLNNDTLVLLKNILLENTQHKFEYALTQSFYDIVGSYWEGIKNFKAVGNKTDLSQYDILFSLGGDGTLLETVTITGKMQHPILGINTGRLGFLTATTDKGIEQILIQLNHKDYDIDERSLIKLVTPSNPFGDLDYALNECAIMKADTSSMMTIHTYIDEHYLNSYWADGLVVSTPTGSTGYSLSCGGPVVVPRSNNFIITPVSVHNLSVRPIVVSDESKIRFEIESRSGQFLVSLDSRSRNFNEKQQITVIKEKFKSKLIKFRDYNYFDTLRQKLNWGLDVRN